MAQQSGYRAPGFIIRFGVEKWVIWVMEASPIAEEIPSQIKAHGLPFVLVETISASGVEQEGQQHKEKKHVLAEIKAPRSKPRGIFDCMEVI